MKKTLLYLLTVVTIFSFNACDKDDEDTKTPEFVGTWVITQEANGAVMKDTLTLTESKFESTLHMQMQQGNFVPYIGTKGTHTYTETTVSLTYTSLGSADINWETGEASHIVWYDAGTDEFNEMLSQMNQSSTLVALWSVSGDELNLKIDMNGDGDYDDENEDTTRTRVK